MPTKRNVVRPWRWRNTALNVLKTTKSKGLTSHSWLEIRLLDDRRMRLEIYADRGYTELIFDPRDRSHHPHFFDPHSTIYDGRVAGEQDLCRPLTAEMLRTEAQTLAKRPYSLSEFNCHHFVLELWNSIVVSALQSAHYPDRAKLGLLWGMEEMMGPWFGASNSNHGGVPSRNSTTSTSRFASMASMGSLGARAEPPLETEARELPTPSLEEVRGQGPVLENVFLLETTGPMRLAELPSAASGYAGYVSGIQVDTSNWAKICLPGLEEHAVRLAETIYNFDIQELAQLLEIPLPSNSFARFSSLSVSKWEYCFVVLRGKELRLAVHFVGPKKLFLLSGDALQRKESDWQWLVEDRHNLSAIGRAFQRKEILQTALRRSAWRRLFGDRDEPFEPVFKDL